MYIKQTTDIKEIESVLFDDTIWDAITDDHAKSKSEVNLLDVCHKYVGGYTEEGCIFAVMCYHYINKELFCHIQVLPKFRRKYALKFANLVLEGEKEVLYTKVPYNHRHMVNFTRRFGFKVIDYYDDGSIKNKINYKTFKLKRDI